MYFSQNEKKIGKIRILLVEDDKDFSIALEEFLSASGLCVVSTGNAREFYKQLATAMPDIVVIDGNLPDENGFEVARFASTHPIGVIILTARGAVGDRITGYEVGADLYFVKPVEGAELVAAIKTLAVKVRGRRDGTVGRLGVGDSRSAHARWTLKTRSRLLVGPDNRLVYLTFQEARLLSVLAKVAPSAADRSALLDALGQDAVTGDRQILDSAVRRLRRTLDKTVGGFARIATVSGVGYSLGMAVDVDPE
jgi:DNA-binding response OmpR family regulator